MLTAVDIVSDPSGPDAWVNAINENKEWVYVNGIYVEKDIDAVKKTINESTVKALEEKALILFENFLSRIK
jgi:hypothetical protein